MYWYDEQNRPFVPTLYACLCDGKIWIGNDWLGDGLAIGLVEKGLPPGDVVLAFHPPEMRIYTEFAVA